MLFWLQSMVKDNAARQLLFDLDQAIQDLSAERGINDPVCVRLSAIYHNLTRRWSESEAANPPCASANLTVVWDSHTANWTSQLDTHS